MAHGGTGYTGGPKRHHRTHRGTRVVHYGPKRIYVPKRQAPRVRRLVRRAKSHPGGKSSGQKRLIQKTHQRKVKVQRKQQQRYERQVAARRAAPFKALLHGGKFGAQFEVHPHDSPVNRFVKGAKRGLYNAALESPVGPFLKIGEATSKAPKGVQKQLGYRGALPTEAHKLAKKLEGKPGQKQAGLPLGKLAGEAVDIVAQTPASVVISAQAANEAAKGRPKKLRKLQKDYERTSAAAALVEGKPGEAFKRFKQHPVATALEVSGARAAVGRTAGAAGRAAGVKAASAKRAPLHLGPKELKPPKVKREYSRDIIAKGAQVAHEKILRKTGTDPEVARRRPSLIPGKHDKVLRPQVLRRVDEDVAAGEAVRRVRREKAVDETVALGGRKRRLRKIKPPPEHHQTAIYLAAERTLRKPETFHADLRKHLSRLEKVNVGRLSKADRRAHADNVAQVKKVLADKKIDPHAIHAAADTFAKAEGSRQARLHELGVRLPEEQNAALVPFATEHMGARYNPKTKRLEIAGEAFDRPASIKAIERAQRRRKLQSPARARARVEQTPVRTAMPREVKPAEVRAEMRRQGVKEPAIISHSARGNPFYIPMLRKGGPPRVTSKRRTGIAQERGTRQATGEAMARQAVGSEGFATAYENFYRQVNQWGVNLAGKTKEGKTRYHPTYDKAQRAGEDLTHNEAGDLRPGHVPLVPLNVAKFRELKPKLDAIERNTQDITHIDAQQSNVLSKAIKDSLEQGTGRGQYILIPQDVADRLQAHHFETSEAERVLQKASTHWKNVVLTTAAPVSWMSGNAIDLVMRTAAAGLGPGARVSGGRILKAVKRLEGEGKVPKGSFDQAKARITPGALFSSSERLATHRPMTEGAMSKPVLKQVSGAWRKWYQGVYRFEGAMERQPQIAALGKAARQDVKATTRDLKEHLGLSGKAIDQYAQKLAVDKDLQSQIAQKVDDVVGRWGKTSPTMRRTLMTTGPFLQWLRVALKYTFVTLPAHHPIKTGIAAGLYEMTDAERLKLGLTLMPHKGGRSVEDYQQGSIPVAGGKLLRFQKFTSFGLAGGGPGQLSGFFFPQIKSFANALDGKAWTGDDLEYPPGHPNAGQKVSDGDRLKLGMYFLAEGFVPFASMARRTLEKGGSSHPTSTLVPLGGHLGGPKVWKKEDQKGLLQGFKRSNNPFRPLKPRYRITKPKGANGGGGGGGLPPKL